MVDNSAYKADNMTMNGDVPNGKMKDKWLPASDVKKTFQRTKSQLQENQATKNWFPPSGRVSTCLTLAVTIIIIFGSARVVMGDIADVGGTIFALLVLILLALIGGKIITLISWCCKKFCKVNLPLPPLLGMLIVGIILKNVPYNFGQFGRAECTKDHKNASFVDSIHDLDDIEDHSSWKRKRSVADDIDMMMESGDAVIERIVRSVVEDDHDDEDHETGNNTEYECRERYIGHDLDPFISRTLRSICLTVILLMAGLELDPVQLSKLSGMVVRATFIPCLVEAVAVAVLSNLILGFPWTVGFMLGFILAGKYSHVVMLMEATTIIPCFFHFS